ncbi:MAG: methylmalonyl Co-A mutase-associated GTPase MeaB, partial [Massilibacteroides sp.]|nr:methylmalonyl Co-A mutase-associated GTPase MeaB [Massilibacteroides sp.]
DMVDEYMRFTRDNGYFYLKRNEQAKYWMYETINESLRNAFYRNETVQASIKKTEQQVLNNEISSFVAAHRMMELFLADIKK